MKRMIWIGILLLVPAFSLRAQEHNHNAQQHDEMNKRGNHAMGFSQAKSKHTFQLMKEGGSIEVKAIAADDTKSRDEIRAHLREIAKLFKAGDFNKPQFIHDQAVPGTKTMARLKESIEYRYAELPAGGKVTIRSTNAEAIAAIHEFLKFQIEDHKTGDSTEVHSH